jgi:hypothetical protein
VALPRFFVRLHWLSAAQILEDRRNRRARKCKLPATPGVETWCNTFAERSIPKHHSNENQCSSVARPRWIFLRSRSNTQHCANLNFLYAGVAQGRLVRDDTIASTKVQITCGPARAGPGATTFAGRVIRSTATQKKSCSPAWPGQVDFAAPLLKHAKLRHFNFLYAGVARPAQICEGQALLIIT